MVRYLLLFAALCGYLQLLERPAEARRGLFGAIGRGAARATYRATRPRATPTPDPGAATPPASSPAPTSGASVPAPPPAPVGAGAPNWGPLSNNIAVMRKFESVQPAGDSSEAEPNFVPARPVRVQKQPDMAAYPEPPGSSAMFVNLPESREPSFIRQRRLDALLLPQPVIPRRVVSRPSSLTGKCISVRDGNHIVVRQGNRTSVVELAAVQPGTGAEAVAAKRSLTKLVLNKPVTVYPAKKPGETGAWVFCGGSCANKELVATGAVRVQPKVAALEPKLVEAEAEARSAKIGVWAKN